jgi:transposase
VAAEMGVTEKTVRQIFTKLIKRLARAWRFEAPQCLGIDEVYIAGVARCILTDLPNRKIINLLKKRDMLTLRRHLLQIKHPERIKIVVIDMWRAYRDEALKRFPSAVIVIDKYHILRLANAAVISVHRRLRRKDKTLQLPKIYLLRKRKHKLHKAQCRALEKRLEQLPELKEAYRLKEELFNYWNCEHKAEAEQRVDEWVRKIPVYLRSDFEELLSALKNWRQEIFNYFDCRDTNAFTESLNSIIKSMQRAGRGYTFEVARAKLLYGGKFSTSTQTKAATNNNTIGRRAKRKKKARPQDAPPNPHANVQLLKQIRLAEDEFNELMRPPKGFAERFEHLGQQLDLTF